MAPGATVRRKLVKAIMLSSMAALLLTGVGFVVHDFTSFRRFLVKTMVTRANILGANSTAALAFRNPEDASQVLQALAMDPNMVAAALYDRQDRLLATYPANASPGRTPPAAGPVGHRFERSHLIVAQPVVKGDVRLGTLYLESSLRDLDDRLRVDAVVLLFAIMGSVALAFTLSTWLQRRIAEPVLALAIVARGNADLERRVAARTQELEASNKELEAFTYSVSHDLRAPLRHIDGFVELLSKHAGTSLDEKSRRHLSTISSAARKMGTLIDDLLDFSRMGRTEMRKTSVDLAVLAKEVVQELRADAPDRHVDWHLGDLPVVQGDPAMLRLVLMNLFSNALKYSARQETARIEVGVRSEKGEVVVAVHDNGVGFDPTYGHKLFGVFQRLHGPADFEGTGIGLANVRRIVSRHGGRTWAEGVVDGGATFFFSLPSAIKGTP